MIYFSVFSQTKEKFLKWQDKPVLGIAFSPDGEKLASVGADKKIKIWDINKGELLSTLYDNVSGEVSISFSPDGKNLVSGSWDQSVKIWDINTGEVIRRFNGHEKSLRAASYSPTGKFIASAGWDKEIIIWYEPTGLELMRLQGHTQCIRAIDYSPDGKFLASGGYDLYLRIHDISNGYEVFSFKGHKYPIEALSYSPDGKFIATGGNDNIIKLWDTQTNKLAKTLNGHTDGVYSVSFSPDGKYLASGGNDFSIKIWDIQKGICIRTLTGHQLTIKSVAFSPNGKILVSASADKTIRVWDVEDLNISSTKRPIPTLSFNENDTSIFKISKHLENGLELYERDYKLKLQVKNLGFENYKVYVNKKEHFKFDGSEKKPNPPIVKDLGNGYLELTFDIYLFPDENEIQIYADKNNHAEFYVSKPFFITYSNLQNYAKISNLFFFDINPIGYTDKKMNKMFSQTNSVDIQTELSKQKGVLFKNVSYYGFPEIENLTPTTLNTKFKMLEQPISSNDVIIVSLTGIFLKNMNKQYFLLPNAGLKDFETSVYQIDSLLDVLSKKSNNLFFLLNNTGSPSDLKEYENTLPEELAKYIFVKLFDKKIQFSILSFSNTTNSISELLKQCISNQHDVNQNNAIEFKEINNYISKFVKTNYSSKGKLIPFYHFFETSSN